MISHAWRCIFVHQRKSAGTSVKAMFPDAAGVDRSRFNQGILAPHWDEDDPVIRDYLKFTVIRNPWDRFISGWKHCRSTKHRSVLDVLENLPRESLLSNVVDPGASWPARWHYGREILRQAKDRAKYAARTALGREDDPPQRAGHEYRHVTRQQVETVVHPDGRLAMDRVVFFEDLDAGLAEVCRALGKPWSPPPALRVKRSGDDYRRHFDDRSREAFARAFRRDIEYWGYDFDTGLPSWPGSEQLRTRANWLSD